MIKLYDKDITIINDAINTIRVADEMIQNPEYSYQLWKDDKDKAKKVLEDYGFTIY